MFTIITILCVLNNIKLNYDQVYEGSVAHKNSIRLYDAVDTINGIRLESAKQVTEVAKFRTKSASTSNLALCSWKHDHCISLVCNSFCRRVEQSVILSSKLTGSSKFNHISSCVLSYNMRSNEVLQFWLLMVFIFFFCGTW